MLEVESDCVVYSRHISEYSLEFSTDKTLRQFKELKKINHKLHFESLDLDTEHMDKNGIYFINPMTRPLSELCFNEIKLGSNFSAYYPFLPIMINKLTFNWDYPSIY